MTLDHHPVSIFPKFQRTRPKHRLERVLALAHSLRHRKGIRARCNCGRLRYQGDYLPIQNLILCHCFDSTWQVFVSVKYQFFALWKGPQLLVVLHEVVQVKAVDAEREHRAVCGARIAGRGFGSVSDVLSDIVDS